MLTVVALGRREERGHFESVHFCTLIPTVIYVILPFKLSDFLYRFLHLEPSGTVLSHQIFGFTAESGLDSRKDGTCQCVLSPSLLSDSAFSSLHSGRTLACILATAHLRVHPHLRPAGHPALPGACLLLVHSRGVFVVGRPWHCSTAQR